MHIDLRNNPDRHRGRLAAQAALSAHRNGDTEEANRILSEVLSESFTDLNGGLIGSYCDFTMTLLSAILQTVDKQCSLDVEELLQTLFLELEAD